MRDSLRAWLALLIFVLALIGLTAAELRQNYRLSALEKAQVQAEPYIKYDTEPMKRALENAASMPATNVFERDIEAIDRISTATLRTADYIPVDLPAGEIQVGEPESHLSIIDPNVIYEFTPEWLTVVDPPHDATKGIIIGTGDATSTLTLRRADGRTLDLVIREPWRYSMYKGD